MTHNREGIWTLDDRIREGGYGADENIPGDYRARIEQDPDWQQEIDKFVSLVPRDFKRSDGTISLDQAEVLDIGAGPGIITDKIVDRVKKVTAIDLEENMTHELKERYQDNDKVNVARGSFLEIPLADGSVDLILSSGTIWHVPVEKKGTNGESLAPDEIENMFLSESLRVLRPGGVYILNGVWNGENPTVANEFDQKRAEEIDYIAKHDKEPLNYRNSTFVHVQNFTLESIVNKTFR